MKMSHALASGVALTIGSVCAPSHANEAAVGLQAVSLQKKSSFASIPVEDKYGRIVGQVDFVHTEGETLKVLSYRQGRGLKKSDGSATVQSFGPNAKSTGMQGDREPTVIGYGSQLVAQSGGVCVLVIYEELSNGDRRFLQVVTIPCETETIGQE